MLKGIVTVAVVIITIFIVYFGVATVSNQNRSEQPWNVDDIDGDWGTEIIVGYKDGTFEYLTESLPTLEIQFRNKAVDYFEYILSTKGTSSSYETIEMDLSNFEVSTTINGQSGQWGEKSISSIISVAMDDNWWTLYSVKVDASELEVLEIGKSYNLSFAPSGIINYRGASTDSWNSAPLPNWFYLHFMVRVETSEDPYDPNPEKWIDVETDTRTVDYK